MIPQWRSNLVIRRLTFLGINLAAIALVASTIVIPVSTFLTDRDIHIAEQQALLSRLKGIADQEAFVQSLVRQAGAQPSRAEFLTGQNENSISADLQTRIKTAAETAGARLISIQALPPRNNAGAKYIGSRLELHGPIQAIEQSIHTIESGRPFLFIVGATIKAQPRPGGQNIAQAPVIQAQLDIFGALQPEEGRR